MYGFGGVGGNHSRLLIGVGGRAQGVAEEALLVLLVVLVVQLTSALTFFKGPSEICC